ncbi:MAG TPA: 50S ribosomal protein L18 [Rectinema sp.]|nr:50S ribosomal protein L18 [Rectinema sp.]
MSIRELTDKRRKREKRRSHIRKDISGTPDMPRMTVYRSNLHLYVQVIDDIKGNTLASASTMEKQFSNLRPTVNSGSVIGEEIGKRLMEKGITQVVFDRNGYKYHGVVKAIADGARKAGVKF